MPSQKELNELFDYDQSTGKLTRKVSLGARSRVGEIVGDRWNSRVIQTQIRGTKLLVHRIIWVMINGDISDDMVIDHIDHNPKNNRINNLRLVTPQENFRNLPLKKNNKTGVNGVYWCNDKKKWTVEIMKDRKKTFIGRFDDLELAKQARKAVDMQYGFHYNHGTVIHGN